MFGRSLLALSFLFMLLATGCGDSSDNTPIKAPDSNYRKYVSAYSSGAIKRTDAIRVVLSEPSIHYSASGEVPQGVFKIRPAVEGSIRWENDRSIVFQPTGYLESGARYDIEVQIGELLDVEQDYRTFSFSLMVRSQSVNVNWTNLRPYEDGDIRWNELKGSVLSSDFLEDEIVEDMMGFELNGTSYTALWNHDIHGMTHHFTLDSIERVEGEQTVVADWEIDIPSLDTEGSIDYTVPSISDFSYRNAEVKHDPEHFINIQFTDPVDPAQDLKGLIRLKQTDDLRFEVESNAVKVYTKSRLKGSVVLIVSDKVRNSLGYGLKKGIEVELDMAELEPNVRSVFSGTILPSTSGRVFPFEAVNLRSVDVTIKRIFENNIPQFLQVNDLDGEYQLARVARTVVRKKIDLSNGSAMDLSRWNTFTLDLDELIGQEPGAIYQVHVSFRPSYSTFECETAMSDDGFGTIDDDDYSDGYDGDYYYDDYYYDDYSYSYRIPGFRWDKQEDPCHVSYYANKGFKHNILATDIGLIAKVGKDNKVYVAANDLKSTAALSGIEMVVYDRQNQVIGTSTSGAGGESTIDIKGRPNLLVASRGEERAYLRLADGNALSMSQFNVGGREVQDGLKGFIYGERGVWRPGDTLFLDFILEDADARLPKGHPVIMEVTDATGRMVSRVVKNQGLNGFYSFPTPTDPDAPTGFWNATVKVGAASFSKSLSVEAIKPNRLKMMLDFGERIVEGENGKSGTLTTTWLHGSKAKNLKAEVALQLRNSSSRPDKYTGYIFSDPSRSFSPREEIVYNGDLDDEGQAQIPLDLDLSSSAPGLLKAYFTTKVYEAGGGYSVSRESIPYSPFSTYLGIQMPKGYSLEGGSTHTIPLVATDMDGEPVKASGLRVEVYDVDWRWWWEGGNNSLASYVSGESRYRLQSFEVPAFTGETTFELTVPDEGWSRYLLRVVDPNGGHATGSTFYGYRPWRPGSERDNPPGGATMLSFETDKEEYQVGDQASIRFPTAGVGRALISIEDGAGIIRKEWVKVNKEMMEYRFDIETEMAPNVYVHVSLLQPHERDNDLPIRMYGVKNIEVADMKTILKPTISMPDKIAPETTVDIEVSEASGREMTYTLALVDEGLLDITGFKTPDPHATFYAREALGVRSFDRYDEVIGAFGGLIKSLLGVGGDEESADKDEGKISRFTPVVRHLGPYTLGAGRTNSHSIAIPNYVGAVKVMVVAGQDKAYGRADKSVKVSKPLMVLSTLPRMLSPLEELSLPVTVFAMEEGIKDVQVSVDLSGPLEAVDGGSAKLTFSEPDEQMSFFKVRTTAEEGMASAVVTVKGGGHTATHRIDLEVKQSRQPESRSETILIGAGESKQVDYSHFAMNGTRDLTLELSSMPAIDLTRRLRYLTGYPHGCAEQTTSKAFPQLYLEPYLSDDPERMEQVRRGLMDVMHKYSRFQMDDGSFSTWPGRNYYSDWTTTYIGHFLIEAKKAGYDVPNGIYDRWLSFTKRRVKQELELPRYYYRYQENNGRAYALYVLALAGEADIASMNRLKTSPELNNTSTHLLAASYHLAGKKDVAAKLLADRREYTPKNANNGYSYGGVDRDRAIILECLIVMGREAEAQPLIMATAERLSGSAYLNTQATAWCLRSALRLGMDKDKDMAYRVSTEGRELVELTTQLPLKRIEQEGVAASGSYLVENKGETPLYLTTVRTGIPTAKEDKAIEKNVEMQLTYLDMQGNEIDITELEQGTEFQIDVMAHNPNSTSRLNDLALTVILPSGWEASIDRLDAPATDSGLDTPDYLDIRDDRVMMYFALDRNDQYNRYRWRQHSKHFRISVSASYTGSYYMPGVKLEGMYDENIISRSAGKNVEVYRP